MRGAAILALLPLWAAAQDDPRMGELMQQLGSDDPQVREKATEELLRTGRSHVRALEDAAARAKDPSTRKKIEEALARIQKREPVTRQRLAAARMDLEAEDRQLGDVAQQISRACGIPIEFDLEGAPDQPVTLSVKGAAVDLILDSICKPQELAWFIRDERKVVIIEAERYAAMQLKLEIYDVRTLTAPVADQPVAALGEEEPREPQSPMAGEDLVQLVKDTIDRASWDGNERSILYQNGLLVVKAMPEVHAKIPKFLARLRREIAFQVRAQLWFVVHRADFLSKELARRPVELDAETVEKIRRAAVESREAILASSFEVVGYNAQLVSGTSGTERACVTGYDEGGNPSLRPIHEGVVFALRPIVSHDRTTATVKLRANVSKIETLERFRSPKGEIHVPAVSTSVVRSMQTVPLDRTVVLSQIGNVKGFGTGFSQVLVLGKFEVSPK
jgi:PHD/YefM family antitoxin component YafN of YafNO toxin-antitoxin module